MSNPFASNLAGDRQMAKRSLEIGGEVGDVCRSLNEVLERTLALGAVVAVCFDAPKEHIVAWLREEKLQAALTIGEVTFLEGGALTSATDAVAMSWRCERLVVLLWALSKIGALPPPDAQCSTELLADLLPPFGRESLTDFRASARLRCEDDLFDAAKRLQDLNALARQRRRNPKSVAAEPIVDGEVVDERHHAANWLVGYSGQGWDEVTTDT